MCFLKLINEIGCFSNWLLQICMVLAHFYLPSLLLGMIEIFGTFDIIDDDCTFNFLSSYWKLSSVNNYHVSTTEGN